MKRFFKHLFFHSRLFALLGINIGLFVLAFMVPALLPAAKLAVLVIVTLLVVDFWLLYGQRGKVVAERELPDKFSNGDQNPVVLHLENQFRLRTTLKIIDEVPIQFQWRDSSFSLSMAPGEQRELKYLLRPTSRGAYHFGKLHVYAASFLSLVRRRFSMDAESMVPTYPSYVQMRQYQLMAISNRLSEVGVKKIRRLGHTTEFEQIKEYVRGDDYRTVNWKATARTGKLMVNQYMDERAQNVYCLIDESRVMKMPFEGMTLLDYAINASLVLSNIAIYKHDRGGLITFAERIQSCVPASKRAIQMNRIMEVLYNQKTRFLEADYARLYAFVKRNVVHRSLLILFTNFESLSAMRRQLPHLQRLAKQHLLMVIFFENTELQDLLDSDPEKLEDIYLKTIGESFAFEKRQIALELSQHGITTILTPPEQLTVNTVNKYLELKSRGMI
ncbi:MAG: DUF58 domain-containing protein [Bacteroidota bacterium]